MLKKAQPIGHRAFAQCWPSESDAALDMPYGWSKSRRPSRRVVERLPNALQAGPKRLNSCASSQGRTGTGVTGTAITDTTAAALDGPTPCPKPKWRRTRQDVLCVRTGREMD